MRKISVVLAPVALVVGLLFFGSYAGGTDDIGKAQAQTLAAKPNIVFILADDMRKDDMMYMPKTHSLLREQGMGFRNAFVSNAICCPSRATIMRGQYSHNTASGPTPQLTALPPPSVAGEPTRAIATRQIPWPRACKAQATGPGSSAST